MGLERDDLLAQGRLGDVKDGRGPGEASDVDDLDESVKPACIQGLSLVRALVLANPTPCAVRCRIISTSVVIVSPSDPVANLRDT
jgi:hypothetical protein